MFARVFNVLLGAVLLLAFGVGSAAAQWENIEMVEGSYGKDVTLTQRPHGVAEGLSARALSIARSDTTQWAISIIGASPEDTISISYGDEPLPIRDIQAPSDGVGPTKVFVSKETFLTMAETQSVTLRVGDVTTAFPEQLRQEMREIFRRAD